MNLTSAINKINQAGAILVFPIANQKEPASLWSSFFPRSKMRWEWDETGDTRVSDLWHLRTELSACEQVVYSKWYRGRATLFSHEVFKAMLVALGTGRQEQKPLGPFAKAILDELRENSPQSSRELRRSTQLQGKFYEGTFHRALKELWDRLAIVGFGEVDDGALPSLAIGWSGSLFEELWDQAKGMSAEESRAILEKYFPEKSLFLKHLAKLKKDLLPTDPPPSTPRPRRQTKGKSI